MNDQSTQVDFAQKAIDEPARRLIEEHVRRLLEVMGFEQVNVSSAVKDSHLSIHIEAGDVGRLLIGTQGRHLAALQHVMRCVLRQHIPQNVSVGVDVNGYNVRREKDIAAVALAAAKRAHDLGKTVVLRPMSATERRMVHTALVDKADITTESMGQEPNRRVVIKPVFL